MLGFYYQWHWEVKARFFGGGAEMTALGMTMRGVRTSGYGVGILSVENGSGKYPIEDFAFLD
jgi:hypothetical protein